MMLSPRQQHCLRGLGIPLWRERGSAPATTEAEAQVPARNEETSVFSSYSEPETASILEKTDAAPLKPEPGTDSASSSPANLVLDNWTAILEGIHACNACELAQNCTQKVPGVGDQKAQLMIVGEGPGHDEDIRGEPFVGRSGQLLDRMLRAIGIEREQIYITNIVKCRPPNNRDPKPEETRQCRHYLEAQIRQIAPKVILCVGRVSAHNLLDSNQPVGKLIQQMHQLPGTEIPVKVTYHPAYLLRNPSAKAIAWQDLKLLHQLLQ